MKPPRILLINVHSFRNAGDHALTQVTLQQLHKHFPDSDITVSINDLASYEGSDPAVLSFAGWIKQPGNKPRQRFLSLLFATLGFIFAYRVLKTQATSIIPKPLRAAIQALSCADLVVSPPGGYFYSDGKGRNLVLSLSMAMVAVFLGKPLYLLPQSVGPFSQGWERRLTGWLVKRARLILVREEISIHHLSLCGIPRGRVRQYPDMALVYQGDPPQHGKDFLAKSNLNLANDHPLVGITLMDWGRQFQDFKSQERYESAVITLIHHIHAQYKGKVILLTQCWGPSDSENDHLVVSRVYQELAALKDSITILNDPLRTSLLAAVIGQLDILVGTRMHSNIFALSQGVPCIPIGYLHKTLGIARSVGMEEWVIDIHQIDGKGLIEIFDRLYQQKNQVRNHLDQIMLAVTEQIEQVGRLVAADFELVR